MSICMTEEEQLEAIKKGWQRHHRLIIMVLSIVFFLTAGYRYWNWHVEKLNQQASEAYERLMLAVSQQDNKAVRSYAKQLSTTYRQTVYSDVAHLTMAHYFVMHAQEAKARKELVYVVSQSKMPALQDIASIRLARILLSEKAYDQALAQLDRLNDATYLSSVNELKGDVFAATGRTSEAKALYQEASLDAKKRGVTNLFLDMKMNEN